MPVRHLRRDAAVTIEPMRRRHLRRVLRIDAHQSDGRWSPGLFLAELRRGDTDRCYLVASRSRSVIGFAGMLLVDGDAHVTTIAVDPPSRRRGVGTRLLLALARRAVDDGANAMTLEVNAENHAAVALYRRFGLAPAGVRRGYYGEGQDALVLWAEDLATPAYRERLDAIEATIATEEPA